MRAGLAALGVAASVLLAWLPGQAHAEFRPGVDVLAQRGFGDYRNSYSWSMAWFKGKLYVGTSRHTFCVENVTVDYFLPGQRFYQTNRFPNVRCPPRPYDMDLRAEIWQYSPKKRRWRMVYKAPAELRNPRASRRVVAHDIAYRGMVVHRDRRGRKALYIGGVTANEYLPELKRRYPPRLLRTVDGKHFKAVRARDAVVRVPYGNFRPIGFRSLLSWRGRLFATMTPGLTGDGAIYEVIRPWSRRARFRQVSPSTLAVFEMEKFNGSLYAGTGDSKRGYGVWKATRNGRSYWFEPIVTDGAGRSGDVTSVVAMHVFRGRLYVGSSGWYNEQIPASELIRIGRKGRWQLVAGAIRTANGRLMEPISGLRDGFDNMFAAHFWRMAHDREALYVGTNDWSWTLQMDKQFPVLQSLLAGEFGFDMWASCDGRYWFPVTRTAFGENMYDFGARNLISSRAGLFVGSANHAQGTTVWRQRVPACASLVGRRRPNASRSGRTYRAPGTPQKLLTDAQREGTVVSWERSPEAARYRVMRASYESVRLNVAPPPALPNGFRLEDQVPMPTEPGAPGSTEVSIPTRGSLTPIGVTSAEYFVDRTREPGTRYAYQVVAETASGTRSTGSNLQVVPDPRAPATFKRLWRAIAGSPTAALAAGARAAMSRSEPGGALRRLRALRRAAGRDDEVADLADRLERRIRYRNVAGGPCRRHACG